MASVGTLPALDEELAALRAASAELYDLGHIGELLGWDQETMMPAKGVSWRGNQQATLSGVIHERLTSPRLADLLKRLREVAAGPAGRLSAVDRAIVREMSRAHDRAVKLPNALVKELAQATSEGAAIWQTARAQSDWGMFRDALARIVDLKRRVAEHVGYAGEPYNALLDEYEPGATVEQLGPMFDRLRADTVTLLGKIRDSGRTIDRSVLEAHYPVDDQWRFGETVLGWMGFDFEAGRQDRSTHPFCASSGVGDVRITTRLNDRDLPQALFGSMHEGGHALYEQGIGQAVHRSAIGGGVSLGVHESQSRLWENCVGRGHHFWRFALPRLAGVFPEQLRGVEVETFWRAINRVEPTFIRVEADEVTYNLHILLRFEIERALFAGQVSVDDLPALWNERMQQVLGVTPPDDRRGVLQDIHWSFGLFGYFPTYTLGNLYGAQLWAAIGRDIPDRDEQVARGELGAILAWLRQRIHAPGGTYLPNELIERATGEPPNPCYLTEYLNQKYAAVYGF